jgi:hypothetical protein
MAQYTTLETLFTLARKVGDAKRSHDTVAIEKAEKELHNYEKLVKSSDGIVTGYTMGQLY